MRLGPEDWEKIQAQYEKNPVQDLIGALLDLHDQVTQVQLDLEDARDHEGFNARLEALKAAREHVNGLPSEQQNARGYRDHSLPAAARSALELQVARYLLGEDQ